MEALTRRDKGAAMGSHVTRTWRHTHGRDFHVVQMTRLLANVAQAVTSYSLRSPVAPAYSGSVSFFLYT
jgi:hypothetical protein